MQNNLGKELKISNFNFKKHVAKKFNMNSNRLLGDSSRSKSPMQILQSNNSSFLPKKKELSMGIYGTGYKERELLNPVTTSST
jgi:hypothetical protein